MVPQTEMASCVPKDTKAEYGEVINVIDGDTIDVRIGDEDYRVRYIGIDTPEYEETFGTDSRVKNSELVERKWVLLVKDVSEVDRYDRLLRYVFAGDVFVNHELVYTGFAEAKAYPPDTACHSIFQSAEYHAISTSIGMWKPPPTPFPTAKPTVPAKQPTSAPPTGNCHPSYPTVCIPPSPPDLDCGDIPFRRFKVLPPDPHRFDGDGDGVGCESG